MITKTQSFSTRDGNMFPTLEEAQAHSIGLLIAPEIESNRGDLSSPSLSALSAAVAKSLLANKDKVLDILTTTAKSRAVSRKINGGTKKRTPKPAATVPAGGAQ